MKTVRKLSLLAIAALMLGACSKDTTETIAPVVEGEKVKMSIEFTVPSMETPVLEVAETSDGLIEVKQLPETRFGDEGAADDNEKAVKNLRVLQFAVVDGGFDLSKNTTLANEYISSDNLTVDGATGDVKVAACELAAAADGESHIYFVANAGAAALTGISSEKQFLEQSIAYSKTWTIGNGIPMMSKVYKNAVTYGGSIPKQTLERLFAAVKFTLAASANFTPTASELKMCKVPAAAYFNSETKATSFIDLTITSGTTYYIPQNNQGKAGSGSSDRYEGVAPADATYIDIPGTYDKNGVEYEATYRVYLGKDNETSYEVLSNNAYTVSATIAGLNMNDKRVVKVTRDLSAKGTKTANCYVVSRKGVTYSFNCEYKGNETANANTGTLTGADDAVILWQSDEKLIQNLTLSTDKKTISFEVSDAASAGLTLKQGASLPGNAVIALVDASDKVLWSWHIWSTDYNPYAATENFDTYTYTDDSGTTIKMMTRNLGAYNNTPAPNADDISAGGLLYQWGRKDPFVGAKSYTTEGKTAFQVVYDGADTPNELGNSWNTSVTVDDNSIYSTIGMVSGKISSAQAVQCPMVFAAGSVEWNSDGKDDTRWGCALPDEMTVNKTINDPCPYGWHVPARQTWNKTGYTTANSLWGNYGRTFYGSVYYPASGCRNSSSGALGSVGANGCSWSASPNSSGDRAGYLSFSSGSVGPLGNGSRSSGFPVRCARN